MTVARLSRMSFISYTRGLVRSPLAAYGSDSAHKLIRLPRTKSYCCGRRISFTMTDCFMHCFVKKSNFVNTTHAKRPSTCGDTVPEVGLEPHPRPCRHWEAAETC